MLGILNPARNFENEFLHCPKTSRFIQLVKVIALASWQYSQAEESNHKLDTEIRRSIILLASNFPPLPGIIGTVHRNVV